MCDCSDFEAPAVFEEITRRSRKRHRCCECKGLIEPGHYYWESRGLWDGKWGTFRTCGSCFVLGRNLVGCYTFCDLSECIAEEFDLWNRRNCREVRAAYAGMLRRGRRADRVLRRGVAV
jgi:hypothetical protein